MNLFDNKIFINILLIYEYFIIKSIKSIYIIIFRYFFRSWINIQIYNYKNKKQIMQNENIYNKWTKASIPRFYYSCYA